MSGFDGEYHLNTRQGKNKRSVDSQESSDLSPLTSRKVSLAESLYARAHHHHGSADSAMTTPSQSAPGSPNSTSVGGGPSQNYKGFHFQGRNQSVPPLQHPIKPKTKKSLFGKFINSIKDDNRKSLQSMNSTNSSAASIRSPGSRMSSVSGFRDQMGLTSLSDHNAKFPPSPKPISNPVGPKDSLTSSPEGDSHPDGGPLESNDFSNSVVAINVNDLMDMNGIVMQENVTGVPRVEAAATPLARKDTWAAPESWDVKNEKSKHDVTKDGGDDDEDYVIRRIYKVKQLDDKALDNKKYHMRIYGEDDDFSSILKRPFNETVDELITFLKRKYQLIGDYKLSLRVGKVTKKLESNQKPIKIQTNLLLLSGYLDTDNLNEVGRADLSYLFKFILHHDVLKQLSPAEEEYINRDLVHVNLKSKDLQKIPALCYSSKVQSLDVSNNGDITLPLDFFQMSNSQLSGLRMVNIRTKVFPPNIVHAKELVSLDLERNFISMVPEDISMLKNLSILTLSCNKLTSLPPLPTCLKILDLSSNEFVEYPETVNDLTNLLQLDLSYNELRTLPPSINKLKSAKKINISSNYLATVDINMPNLRTLNLRHNDITKICLNESNLENLYLTNNHISNISDALPSLKTLDLQRNPITQLNTLSHNLASLNLSKAKLTALPTVILSFTKLEKLELSKNALRELPDISALQSLRELSVYSNNLESIPDLKPLTKLKILDVHDNNLKTIPDVSFVEILNISSNLISELPQPKFNNLLQLRAADNQLDDNALEVIKHFIKLRVLSVAYNKIVDIPTGTLSENVQLDQLYLAGNALTTLPDDFEEIKNLRVLCLNGNRFRTLPAGLAGFQNLEAIDVGSNDLKYNTSNSKYEWNWKENQNLRYLNLSGNKKFEINEDLNLPKLRVLGLMDLTITTQAIIPDDSMITRVRTTPTTLGDLQYGISDRVNKVVIARDSVCEQIDGGVLVCLFDGFNSGKISYVIRENFHKIFEKELENSDIVTALRHSFLQLNAVVNDYDLNTEDNLTGSSATAVYIKNNKIYVANIGDTMAMLAKPDGSYNFMSVHHQPSSAVEFDRIRTSGGFVSSNDKVDGVSQVSRAAGFIDLLPHVHTGADISETTFDDESLVIGTKELFDHLPIKTIADIVRENDNPIRTAEKLRDYAISYGCDTKVAAIVLTKRKTKKKSLPVSRQQVEDSNLRRLKPEIQPPIGELAMVFTDIKNSTQLWENYPLAMRSAIKTHNSIMRRQLHIVGGYEVKTEGDAFMVSFPTVTSAMIWCFNVQQQLLQEDWPAEILQSEEGHEFRDADGNVIYKGLSVRMGIHWGVPVCEPDLITRRMDYFGPMVNKTARVCAVADGGEITLTLDCLNEFQRIKAAYKAALAGTPREVAFANDEDPETLANEFSVLSAIDWMYRAMGKVQLKGLETEEEITVIFPKQLKNRYRFQRKPDLNTDDICRLRNIVLRLDRVSSHVFGHEVEKSRSKKLDNYLEKHLFEIFIARVEHVVAMLALRDNTVGLFDDGYGIFDLVDKITQMVKEHSQCGKIEELERSITEE
jgi:adenylate cyclase